MPLMMPSVSGDAYTGANSITLLKESCDTLIQVSSPTEENGATDDAVSIT